MTSLSRMLVGLVVAMISLIVATTVVFMKVEDLTPVQALYFAVVTFSTVGYGDIYPKTSLGMILSVIMILGGVGFFMGSIGLISNAIVSRRDRKAAEAKIELLSEIFLRMIAIGLLERFTASNPQAERLRAKLAVSRSWSEKDFERARNDLDKTDFVIDLQTINFSEWYSFLASQSQVFLHLLSNPAISEGLSLTSVLRRTFHLALAVKSPNHEIPTNYTERLREDIEPVYRDLTLLWLDYMASMMREFPSAVRHLASTSPFRSRMP